MSKVLIIEDEQSIAALAKDYLELYDFEVSIENDGQKGLDRALLENYDIVIVDLMLPTVDGFEICKRIREVKDIPILVVSAKKEDIDKIRGLELGADDYITKPYNPTILLLRINALLKRAAASSANNSTFYRGMEILPQKGVIKYNDGRDEMLLTKNEMTIFMCLLAKKDRIVSRDELMTELWNNEEYLNDNALTVNISRLRARFKDIGIEDVIETRKGQGYILV